MHFDAAGFFIEDCLMRKPLQVEVGAEFAIDAGKEVEIKGGGNADRVVVRDNQFLNWLEHVGAEEKRVPGLENEAQIAKKVRAGGAIEVADVAAEKENEQMFARSAASGDFAETVEIFPFEADNADAFDVAEFAAKNGESGRRKFNGVVPGGLPAGEGFEEQARFAAGAAAELGDDDGPGKLVDDFPCVQLKQALLGARNAILRKLADDLKEGGADRIVEVFRGEFLLSRPGESGSHFQRKLAEQRRAVDLCLRRSFGHSATHSDTQRNPAYAY